MIEDARAARSAVDDVVAAARADAEGLVGKETVARAIGEQRRLGANGIESPDELRGRWNREDRAAAEKRALEAKADSLLDLLRRLR